MFIELTNAGLYHCLKNDLKKVQGVLPKTAKVSIQLALNSWLDPEDLLQTGLHPTYMGRLDQAHWFFTFFHAPTIARLPEDTALPWPARGDLSVDFILKTALYCTLEDQKEASEERVAFDQSGKAIVTRKRIIDPTAPCVTWRLRPTEGELSYRGFLPECISIDYGLREFASIHQHRGNCAQLGRRVV